MANEDTTISTDSGASVGHDVQTGRDFVGRDQINFIVPLGDWDEIKHILFRDMTQAVANEATEEQFKTFDWSKAEQAYLDKVIKLYGRMRILGTSVDVPLGNVFTQVYILDKPTAYQRHNINELRRKGWNHFDLQCQPAQRKPGLNLVKTRQNLFILGKPGSGKTTFLRYITIQAARKQLPQIPIFVSLNQWADSQWSKGDNAALLPFIVEQFAICDFPDAELFIDYVLKEGRALVLFDGLDEVKQAREQRRRLTHLLQAFAQKYDKSQYLITCRIAASEYAFAGFANVEMADFTVDQVSEYARLWFGENEKKFEAFTIELGKPENKGLAELCNTPLLLSLLSLTFDNNMRFPPSRAELYEDALETLLRKWDTNRAIQRDEIYRDLSYKRKLQLLMRIAVPNFERGEIFFRQRDLERWIADYLVTLPGTPPADSLDGTSILKAIEAQHSILVERAQNIYSFSHLTFQEYLTARYAAENQGKGASDYLIHSYLTDKRWHEIFLLTASLLDNADEFIATMRTITDSLLVSTPSMSYLFAWAYDRAQGVNISVERRHTIQLAYIFLASALTCWRSRLRVRPISEAFANESMHSSVLVSHIATVLASKLDLDLLSELEHSLSFELMLDLTRTPECILSLANATTAYVGFDYGLYYVWVYAALSAIKLLDHTDKGWQPDLPKFLRLVNGIAALANAAGLAGLAKQLITQPSPMPNTSVRDWQQYATFLFAILRYERDLGREWDFRETENDTFSDYLYVTELLVQCLNVAVVSNRRAVLYGLLLPPKIE